MSDALPQVPNADELTEILRRAGALADGRVRDVTIEGLRPTILSRVARLRLIYEGRADGAPTTLFIKTPLPERAAKGWHGGRREVDFYLNVAAKTPPGILPRCFDAQFDDETNDWRLVLEDLSETHQIRTVWPLPPTPDDCREILSAWARLHAAWWDAPELGLTIGAWLEPDQPRMEYFAERYERFAHDLGDRLSLERREVYRRLIENGHRLGARLHSRKNMTITHGDAHPWNVMLPLDSGGSPRLFDWDTWRVDVAASDVAYMMSVHWFPDYRRRFEIAMLDHYFAELQRNGVAGYDLGALSDDYRLSTLWRITTPVWQYIGQIPAGIWWNHLDRVFSAVDDLDCRALLS